MLCWHHMARRTQQFLACHVGGISCLPTCILCTHSLCPLLALLTHCSDSDGENPQPIKRSRSDQSLSATAQLAAAAAAGRSSSGSGGGTSGPPYGVVQQLGCVALSGVQSSYPQPQYARAQRAPSLPVVLSDVGSSTNSLLSLDSEATRSTSQQHLHLMQGVAGAESPAAAAAQFRGQPLARRLSSGTAEALSAVLSQQGAAGPAAADSSGSPPHAGSRGQHSSSGLVCSLNPVSSAASLTQAQLWARGYDMTRTISDASLSSGGYSAALQQLGLPLTAYSPPPLLSPGPTSLGADRAAGAAAAAAAAVALGLGSSSAGPFQPGLSIQQQKQASFQGPSVPADPPTHADQGVFMSAALGSSSWGMRAVNSRDSLHSSESITSVEAGERLAGVRFGLHPSRAGPPGGHTHHLSPSQLKQGSSSGGGAGAPPQLPPLSPAGAQSGAGSSGVGLVDKRNTSFGSLGAAGPAHGSSRAAAQQQQPHGGSFAWVGGRVTSPGLASEPSESNMSLLAGEQRAKGV